jgi:lysophospholipase
MALVLTDDNPAPPGAVEQDIHAADGVQLRTVRWTSSSDPLGTVAVFGGRGEFIEKYFEVAGDLVSRGFTVAVMDWRGQGGSERPLRNARKGHVDDFSYYGRDLDAFVGSVLAPHCPRPWFGLGHSMGAAILLMVDEAGRCPFERLVLVSPMIAYKGVNPRGPMRYLSEALDAVGMGAMFIPGEGSGNAWSAPYEGNVFTTDPVRFARIAKLARAAPHLGLGGPTIGWTHAAFRLWNRFSEPNFPHRLATPTLIIASGADRVVDTSAAESFAARMSSGRIIVIDGAQHEILIERDSFRSQFWAAFDAFVPGSKARGAERAAAR